MANRAKAANIANHGRQMEYLRHGVVMIPKLWEHKKPRRRRRRS